MISQDAIFQIWAPSGATWSQWVKPVLFSRLHWLDDGRPLLPLPAAPLGPIENPTWIPRAGGGTAIVVELPGTESIGLGIVLAHAGYRPIPLFNSVPAPGGEVMLVEVRPTLHALAVAAPILESLRLPDRAPPAFLLDSARRAEGVRVIPDRFDNRSLSLPGDFPSAEFLRHEGIRRVILVQRPPGAAPSDLCQTLWNWQQGGIEILERPVDRPGLPRPARVGKPFPLLALFHRLLVALRRNADGGFGYKVPRPSGG